MDSDEKKAKKASSKNQSMDIQLKISCLSEGITISISLFNISNVRDVMLCKYSQSWELYSLR